MRILGFVALGLLIITNLRLGPVISITEFKKPVYSIFVLSLVVNTLALFTVYTYLTVSAVGANIDADLSFDLIAIANAMSAVGQIGSGVFADHFGPFNAIIPAAVLAGVVTYAWPFATHIAAFVVIAVFFG
uniref:MFS domain-containing protein n=1 Tax=Ganoderma boninense TaxID=34458 RepID=A0A5K1JT77_9APHY|nr:MFS domain-containing protein [Ganoderma boninense]